MQAKDALEDAHIPRSKTPSKLNSLGLLKERRKL
jgi:hypothetical protein